MQNHPVERPVLVTRERPWRIGTRASPLARAQTDAVVATLTAAWPDLAAAGALEIGSPEDDG